MITLTCEKTRDLVECLELVEQVRDALAATPNVAETSAHETAVISAASLAEAVEQMIQG